MIALQEACLHHPGEDLRRTDQRAGGDRLDGSCAGCFHDAREMRGHRARDDPGQRQRRTPAAPWCGRSGYAAWSRLAPPSSRRHGTAASEVERQADQDMRCRPGETGIAPADMGEPIGRQRPADGGSKARDQRDAGDRRRARPRHRCGRARRRPRHRGHSPCRCRAGARPRSASESSSVKPSSTRPAASVRLENDSTGRPPTRSIWRPMRGPSRPAIDKRAGIGAKDPVRGDAEIMRDRIGQQRRQIDAGGPGQRLGGAECQDDGELAPAHVVGAVSRWVAAFACHLRV